MFHCIRIRYSSENMRCFQRHKLLTETLSAQGAVVDKNLLVGGGVWGCHLKAPNTLTVEDVSV